MPELSNFYTHWRETGAPAAFALFSLKSRANGPLILSASTSSQVQDKNNNSFENSCYKFLKKIKQSHECSILNCVKKMSKVGSAELHREGKNVLGKEENNNSARLGYGYIA